MHILLVSVVLCVTLAGVNSFPVLGGWPKLLYKNKFDSIQKPFSRYQTGTLVPEEEFENWLGIQSTNAFESIIHNIGGYGPDLQGDILKGMAIASPSKKEPDYFYYWVRDSAITANTLVKSHADQYNSTIREILLNYIESCFLIQRTSNPSGTFKDLDGLGEPKFHVDGSAFEDKWGRPQRDGPALRAMSVMNIIITELKYNKSVSYMDFEDIYYRIIKPDLDYTVKKWHLPGFDLWEEMNGLHFFTLMVQQRALSLGSTFASNIGDLEAQDDYIAGNQAIRAFLKDNFWIHGKNFLTETINPQTYGRTGLDSAILLGALHAIPDSKFGNHVDFEDNTSTSDSSFSASSYSLVTANEPPVLFEPYSEKVIATMQNLIQDMETRYPINLHRLNEFKNSGYENTVGVGIGRYPEDVYDGVGRSLGNPWFITTAAVAQSVYSIANFLDTQQDWFVLNTTNQPLIAPFFNQFVNGTDFALSKRDPEYKELLQSLITYGDSFMDVMREHVSNNGDMSEQFSRWDGYMKGADKLTWSYGSFWSAVRERGRFKNRNKAVMKV